MMLHHIQITSKEATFVGSGLTLSFKEPIDKHSHLWADMERLERVASGQASEQEKIKSPGVFIQEMGHKLWEAVFGDHFQPQGVLALELKDDALHYLPWEFMHDGQDYLCRRYGVIRLVEGGGEGFQPVPSGGRLKVLVALASPLLNYDPDEVTGDRYNIDPKKKILVDRPQPAILDVRGEVRCFQNLNGQSSPIDFIIKRRISRSELTEELRACDVLHFSGHGHKGLLALENGQAIEDQIATPWIESNLQNLPLKMAVFSSCWTAAFDTHLRESVAGTFLRLGVPIVMAMRLPITQARGQVFTRSLYRHLTHGVSILEALRLTRQAMWDDTLPERMWEFAVPVLFIHKGLAGQPLVLHQGQNGQKVKVHLRGARMPIDREDLFVARREELVRMAKWLNMEDGRSGSKIVLVHGAGGIGKTALALEAGHRFAENFAQAIFASARRELPVAELQAEVKAAGGRYQSADVASFLRQIARQIDLPLEKERRADTLYALNDAIIDKLNQSDQKWLFILDNLEELVLPEYSGYRLDETALDLIHRLPQDTCRVILTTRYRPQNLAPPFLDLHLTELKPGESAELISWYQQERQVPVTGEQLQTLFTRTKGHPLSMRLLLAQLCAGRAFNDIMAKLDEAKGKTDLFEYILKGALDYAGEDGRRLFACLSLFEPDADRSDLEKVVGQTIKNFSDTFCHLLNLSLMETIDLPLLGRRYSILEVMRKMGNVWLDDEKEGVSIKVRFAELVLRKLRSGYWEKDLGILHRTQRMREQSVLNQAGMIFYLLGRWNEALECCQAGSALAEADENPYGQAAYFNNMGLVYQAKGEWDKALEFYENSLQTKEQVGDRHGMAQTWGNMGILKVQKGNHKEAGILFEQALAIFDGIGDTINAQRVRQLIAHLQKLTQR